MRFLGFSFAATAVSCLAACGGSVVDTSSTTTGTGASTTGTTGASTTGTGASTTGTGGGSTTGTGASTTGTGGGSAAGDCTTNADCGTGTCAPITPGGYLVCLNIAPPATSCGSPMNDMCCKSADCKGGQACYSTPALTECAGGPAVPVFNVCVSDQCESDADCAGGMAPRICAPAGAFDYPLRACFTAYCHTSADCTAQPGGGCVTVSQPCCAVPGGLACVYPGGCREDTECGQGDHCQIDVTKGAGQCTSAPVMCPV